MLYLPLGNLEHQHSESPIAVEEIIDVYFQALNALIYLYSRDVAHRDLKPENILIESRSPLSIKLADFGLANNRPDLKTFCGTERYAAPEVYLRSRYTASVDLWSLGVIILQYMYGLPQAPGQKRGQHKNSQARGLAWCRRVVDYTNDWESDALIDLLATGMLQMRAEKRLSASACLTKGCDLRLFDGHYLDSGSATPTRQTALQCEIGDDDGSTTVLLGALWDTEDNSSNHDGASRLGLPNQPTVLKDPRKRLRSSESVSEIQAAKRAQRRSQADSGPGFTEIMEEEINQLGREEEDARASKADTRSRSRLGGDVQSLERTYRHEPEDGVIEAPPCAPPRPPHSRHSRGPTSEVPRASLPRVYITPRQTGKNTVGL